MYLYRGETPIKIYRGKYDLPKIYKGEELLCDENTNIEPWEKISQIIVNGDFSNGTTHYGFLRTYNVTTLNGFLSYTGHISSSTLYGQNISSDNWIAGHKYYIQLQTNNEKTCSFRMLEYDYFTWTAGVYVFNIASHPPGLQKLSVVHTAVKTTGCRLSRYVANAEQQVYSDGLIFVCDLTAAFGAGNEPSAAELDNWANNVGYFEGSKMF